MCHFRDIVLFFHKIGCYAAMKKKIYAMGGGSYGKLFESVECYDPRTQQWTAICPLKERRWEKMEGGELDERKVSFFWWICEDGLWIPPGLSESWWPIVNMCFSKYKHPSNKHKFCRNTVLMLQAIVPRCKMKTRNYSSIGTSEYFLEINVFTVFFFCGLN